MSNFFQYSNDVNKFQFRESIIKFDKNYQLIKKQYWLDLFAWEIFDFNSKFDVIHYYVEFEFFVIVSINVNLFFWI